MLNYSKKLDRKILIPILVILAILFLASTMQTNFATTNSIDNTTTGGISGALNSSNHGDTIELDDGVYTGNNNTNIYINKNITVEGKTKDKVIIDAQGLSRIFIIGDNLNVTFINITFKNGILLPLGYPDSPVIHNNYVNSQLTIINCVFDNNYGVDPAIMNRGNNMNITNCTFINNNATGTSRGGSAIYNSGNNVVINNCIFENNSAIAGGAIVMDSCINLDVINCTFVNNSASGTGGAIRFFRVDNVTIIDCDFINNGASNGGALYTTRSNLTIVNSNFENNSASNGGGAIQSLSPDALSEIIINNSIFINNSAHDGGAIDNYVNMTLSNNNFEDNNGNTNTIYNHLGSNITLNDNFMEAIIIINDGNIDSHSSNNIIDIVQTELSIINVGVSFNRVTITVKAVDENGNLIIGKTINFYVNGVLVGNAVTDSDGIAEFSYNVSNYGVQNIIASLDEFNETFDVENITDFAIRVYSAATNTTSINVAKTNTNATIIVSNATTGKQTTVSGVLVDENGNPIAGASLNVVIGGKSYSVVTGADGKWELPYTPSKAGNYNAKVYYSGDFNYLASTGSVAYTVAQGSEDPKKTDIRLVKRNNSKAVRHGNVVYMKWLTFKNFGASGSQTINTKVIIKNLKYKLWKVYNKKLNYKFAKNNIKFKLNLKSNGVFKLKLKVYRPIKQK